MKTSIRFTLMAFGLLLVATLYGRPIETTTAFLTKDQYWETFRQRFPGHIQIIGKSHRQEDGSYVFILSEPPPHVSTANVKDLCVGYEVYLEEKKCTLGFDGWTKDLLIVVNKSERVAIDALYKKLYKHLFFTDPPGRPLDLNAKAPPVFFATETLNYEVRPAELTSWLLGSNAMVFGPLEDRESYSLPLAQILEKQYFGIWVSKEPILLIWVLPDEADITGKQAEIRQFAENIDFIIGALKTDDGVAIVAHKRTVPEEVLPAMRTETILTLAEASGSQLGQSYERDHPLAGKVDGRFDAAPIYLSDELQNTDFGSLLNTADQMLKSWSLNGSIEYFNFQHPKPLKWPFPRPLNQIIVSEQLSFNGNMIGATQTLEFESYGKLHDLSLLTVSRTGAMPVTYTPGNVGTKSRQDSVTRFEETGWKFFAASKSPVWAQTVRYAVLFRFFKTFGITAQADNTGRRITSPKALQTDVFRLIHTLDQLDEAAVADLSLKSAVAIGMHKELEAERARLWSAGESSSAIARQLTQKVAENWENLYKLKGVAKVNRRIELITMVRDTINQGIMLFKGKLMDIKKRHGADGLKQFADLLGNPGALKMSSDDGALLEEMRQFAKELAEVSSNYMLFEFIELDLTRVMQHYSQENESNCKAWLKTPIVVKSYCTDTVLAWTGGHNIGAGSASFIVAKNNELVTVKQQSGTQQLSIAINESVLSQLTPEMIRWISEERQKVKDTEGVLAFEKELHKTLATAPIQSIRKCEAVFPMAAR